MAKYFGSPRAFCCGMTWCLMELDSLACSSFLYLPFQRTNAEAACVDGKPCGPGSRAGAVGGWVGSRLRVSAQPWTVPARVQPGASSPSSQPVLGRPGLARRLGHAAPSAGCMESGQARGAAPTLPPRGLGARALRRSPAGAAAPGPLLPELPGTPLHATRHLAVAPPPRGRRVPLREQVHLRGRARDGRGQPPGRRWRGGGPAPCHGAAPRDGPRARGTPCWGEKAAGRGAVSGARPGEAPAPLPPPAHFLVGGAAAAGRRRRRN